MPLQTSGSLSLFNIQTEFGGISPIAIGEYFRGGVYVDGATVGGTGSFQTLPLTPNVGPITIPNAGVPIQFSHFYGTQSVIVGNSGGLILSPPDNDTTSDYVDVVLPAGVDLIRFFLVGGGGGGGGSDTYGGGVGGGGSTLSGTINTSWAGPTNVARTLRFFIGRAGSAGPSGSGNSWNLPAPRGGHGHSMFGIQSTSWGAWMSLYAVTHDMIGGRYQAPATRAARSLYFPNTGTYTFQFLADNGVSIAVDGAVIGNTDGNNDQAYNGGGSYLLGTPLTRTVSLTAGHHKVRFNYTNTGSIGGYAVRIVNNTTASEFWTTRYEYSGWNAYPTGGTNGYAGSDGGSGYGGSGGSATMFSIINGYGTEYFVALAGGGAGGGGGGRFATPPNVTQNANWANQGWTTAAASPTRVSGGDGEYLGALNNNTGAGFTSEDGGGGGAGGGGVTNARQYVQVTNAEWLYSGFGGRTGRGNWLGSDSWADGGESGKSAVTSYATRYADVMHVPTTSRFPINPTNPAGLPGAILTGLNSYGIGGGTGGNGTNGCAYVDWGVVGASVVAPSVSRATIRASIVPYYSFYPWPQAISSFGRGLISFQLVQHPKAFVLDAFGGGGNPGTEYTYSWTNIAGGASISAPTSYRTTITPPDAVSTGTVRCTVSDGTSSAVADYNWEVVPDDVQFQQTCFPAGAMVLMADGTEQAIETISGGDMVMSVNGPVRVTKIDTPILGTRKLLSFADGHTWSEEHSHWTRSESGEQWWWTANVDLWAAEAVDGVIGGLSDNSTMRTGDGFEFAHVDGWKNNTITETTASYDLQLYLPLTTGAPIIVNGYLVGAGINEAGFDYTTIDWDTARLGLTPEVARVSGAVDPVQIPKPAAFPPGYEPPPVPWTLPLAP